MGQTTGKIASLLRIRRNAGTLGVEESTWREALQKSTADPAVGIRHAVIQGTTAYRIHVAAIPEQVGCHYHRNGDEDYSIVEGEGVLHFARVTESSNGPLVLPDDWNQVHVIAGDCFVIPEGYAHQLRRRGSGDLTILFGCPDSHLDDTQDRTILPDAP